MFVCVYHQSNPIVRKKEGERKKYRKFNQKDTVYFTFNLFLVKVRRQYFRPVMCDGVTRTEKLLVRNLKIFGEDLQSIQFLLFTEPKCPGFSSEVSHVTRKAHFLLCSENTYRFEKSEIRYFNYGGKFNLPKKLD
jgi:hypothetical protein